MVYLYVLSPIFWLVDIIQNKNFKKVFFNKLVSDLANATYHPHGQEIWIFDLNTREWFFTYQNDCKLWYNQKIFGVNLSLFSIEKSDNQKLLKLWFENYLKLPVHQVSSKNTNMDYYLDGILNTKKYKWSIKERFGFSYNTIKKYLDLESRFLGENVKITQFLDEI